MCAQAYEDDVVVLKLDTVPRAAMVLRYWCHGGATEAWDSSTVLPLVPTGTSYHGTRTRSFYEDYDIPKKRYGEYTIPRVVHVYVQI